MQDMDLVILLALITNRVVNETYGTNRNGWRFSKTLTILDMLVQQSL